MPMILNPAGDGEPIVIDKAVIMLGRHPTCDVILTNSRKVSRKHCCVVQVNDKFFVRDLGSMNGISVNGKRVKKENPLNLGDLLTVGDVDYRFQLGNAVRKKAPTAAKPEQAANAKPLATAAGLAESGIANVAPVIPVVGEGDDYMPGLAPLDDDTAGADFVEVVEPEIIEDVVEVVEPELVDDVVEVMDDVEVVDDVLIVDEIEEVVDVVEVYEDPIDVVEVVDEIEVVDDVLVLDDVQIVDDVVEVVDDVDVIEVVDDVQEVEIVEDVIEVVDDDFDDVILVDDDDDFFDGPIELVD